MAREPIAGQQINQWQQALLNTQQEIIQWSQKNNLEIGPDLMQLWNSAMQKGDEASYNNFMKVWNEIQRDPEQYKKYINELRKQSTPEPWRLAIINQIEGQNMIANLLGLNISNELQNMRERAMKDNGSGVEVILNEVKAKWNQIDDAILKNLRETPAS